MGSHEARRVDQTSAPASNALPHQASRMPHRRTSLPQLLQAIDGTLRPLAASRGLAFSVEPVTPLPTQIEGDSHRLWQIVMAIAENAVRFTAAGSVSIRCGIADLSERPTLELDIADTGGGFSVTECDELFEARPSTEGIAETWPGSGLSLMLARTMAQLMDGEIMLLRNERGVGATLRISLPVTIPSDATFVLTIPIGVAATSSACGDGAAAIPSESPLHVRQRRSAA